MGENGEQDINYMQNRTLNESKSNGIDVFLFEVWNSGEYTYRGKVALAGEPYQTEQLDQKRELRKVWIFPLKIMEKENCIDGDIIYRQSEIKRKRVRHISDEYLIKVADSVKGKPGIREIKTTTFQRSEYVVEYAKRRANGKCQLCGHDAPFKDKNGDAYLEVHHIEWLSKGGEDTIFNAVALCPNCHRKMHSLGLEEDIKKLKKLAEEVKWKY